MTYELKIMEERAKGYNKGRAFTIVESVENVKASLNISTEKHVKFFTIH